MANDTEQRYDIAFAGECLEGRDPETVRSAVGALFKADAATLERLFSGTRQRIKGNCDKATALKYQKSLAKAGAKVIVTRASGPTQKSEPSPPSQPSPPPGLTAEERDDASPAPQGLPEDDDGFELLPGGSDILRPEERLAHGDRDVDLSHLSLAETGDRLSDAVADTAPAVTAPDLAVAEPGARMGPENPAPSSPTPDVSALELAPTGVDLSDARDENPGASAVDTDHLKLAASGSDLLTAQERPVDHAQAPDTSHLTLDTDDEPPEN